MHAPTRERSMRWQRRSGSVRYPRALLCGPASCREFFRRSEVKAGSLTGRAWRLRGTSVSDCFEGLSPRTIHLEILSSPRHPFC